MPQTLKNNDHLIGNKLNKDMGNFIMNYNGKTYIIQHLLLLVKFTFNLLFTHCVPLPAAGAPDMAP